MEDRDKTSDDSEMTFEVKLSVIQAFTQKIMLACRESALGTCLMAELERFIDALEMHPQISDFPIDDIFKLRLQREGLPNSVILQKEKLEQLKAEQELEASHQRISQGMQVIRDNTLQQSHESANTNANPNTD